MTDNKNQISDERKEYLLTYAKQKYKRVPLDLPLNKNGSSLTYDEIKQASQNANEPLNAFIKKAIAQRVEREKLL